MWSPSLKFWAPQTICRGTGLPFSSTFLSPTLTWQSHMWSESGCGFLLTTWAVTTCSRLAPTFSTASTSVPVRVNSATSSLGSAGTSTMLLSHSYETRMFFSFSRDQYKTVFLTVTSELAVMMTMGSDASVMSVARTATGSACRRS